MLKYTLTGSLVLTLFVYISSYGQVDTTWVKDKWDISPTGGVASDTLGRLILDQIPRDENLAHKKPATDMTGAEVKEVTDGKQYKSEWLAPSEEAVGFFLKIDLEKICLLDSIRILPRLLKKRPPIVDTTDFVKGYSVRLSTDDVVYIEVLRNLFNTNPVIDTSFTPTLARYVKVVIAAADNINKVRIAEIEVYGRGYVSEGIYTSPVLDFNVPDDKNFGLVEWKADIPPETELTLQFRTGRTTSPPQGWSDWSEVYGTPGGVLFPALEPSQYFQYQVNFSTTDPRVTPVLEEITVHYSTTPPAHRAYGSIVAVKDTLPHEVPVGTEMDYIYTLVPEFDEKSIGFDKLVIFSPVKAQITGVDTNGVPLTLGQDYLDVSTDREIAIKLTSPVKAGLDSLRVHFRTTLFLDENDFPGYITHTQLTPNNPQYVEENTAEGRSWTIITTGYIPDVLKADMVEVKPNPFSPNGDNINDRTRIKFTVAKLSIPRRISIKIFDLTGTVVWKKDMFEQAGIYEVEWDGRDVDGELLPPGLYIYQIDVDADEATRPVTGTVVVAY